MSQIGNLPQIGVMFFLKPPPRLVVFVGKCLRKHQEQPRDLGGFGCKKLLTDPHGKPLLGCIAIPLCCLGGIKSPITNRK